MERKLRLRDVAEQVNISVPYLSDLERGRANPSLDTLQAIAQGYGLSVKAILADVEGYGGTTPGSLPQGLQNLLADPVLGPQVSPDWIQTLARIEFRGQRPRHKMDWYETYLYLKRILD